APQRTPAAKAAIFTGTYAITAGLALLAFPVTSFGMLFDASAVPTGWIRVGGMLFALIGYQYLGTGIADSPLVNKDGQVHAGPLYARSFYMSSVFSRLFLVAAMLGAGSQRPFFVALVATKQSPVNLLSPNPCGAGVNRGIHHNSYASTWQLNNISRGGLLLWQCIDGVPLYHDGGGSMATKAQRDVRGGAYQPEFSQPLCPSGQVTTCRSQGHVRHAACPERLDVRALNVAAAPLRWSMLRATPS
ncbi:uncharacterized protein HaLaN_23182, partial [Haematococcus lacustris]